MTRHFSTDISSLKVTKPKPRDPPSGFRSTCTGGGLCQPLHSADEAKKRETLAGKSAHHAVLDLSKLLEVGPEVLVSDFTLQ